MLKQYKNSWDMSNRRIALFLLFLNVATSASVSIYISCLKAMAVDLNATDAMMQMTIVAHLVGEFIGRIFCGPLIDTHGNRKVVLPALSLSVLGHIGCMISTNLAFFSIMRFIQAMGASVIYVISLNIINSRFERNEKAEVVGVLELYQPIAWIISPVIGAILAEIGNWRLSFFVLMMAHMFGLLFFWLYNEAGITRKVFSFKQLRSDYKTLLKKSAFTLYSLIPGLFAGGYMIFATSCASICSQFFGNSSADIAIFSAVPLLGYVIFTFVYHRVVRSLGTIIAKRIGTAIYVIFGIYMSYVAIFSDWTPVNLQILMVLQCCGSAFLVPVSVLTALQSAEHAASVGASTLVVFRNIIMSLCISIGARFNGNTTGVMLCVFFTVIAVLMLIMTRRIIRTRYMR